MRPCFSTCINNQIIQQDFEWELALFQNTRTQIIAVLLSVKERQENEQKGGKKEGGEPKI